MTVRLYGHYEHPAECTVCDNDRRVRVSRLFRSGQWLPGGGLGLGLVKATLLAEIIDCPQCTDATELLELLERSPLVATAGGVA